ncbi:MAG: S41 family peptidase, partial [Clostridia bacterium]
MKKDKTYAKGLVTGVFATIFVALLIFLAAVFFNIGNVGNLLQTVKILDHYSLEPLSFSEKAEGAISGMINRLEDPYSYYLDAEEYTDLMEEVSGSYEGLGIYLTTEAGAEYTVVMAPIKGTPAFEAGLLAGDEIVRLNGEDMAGVSADEIATLIKRGEESHFVMEVRRDGEILTFEMDRRHIDIPSVDGSFLEGQEGIAYISISTFADNTPTELEETIASLEEQGTIRGILLDLRNNPGGSVAAVLQVADTFLSQGDHILWVEEKDNETVYDAENTNPLAYPMVVLVNENSASASEILTGALKENDRAAVVGTTTFGKGIIQTIYSLYDGAAVKVTTAEYLSPDKNK